MQRANPELQLSEFVGPRSWFLFELLGADSGWLRKSPDEWETDTDFAEMECIISDLPVVNDTAERAVKKVTEYADSARDGWQRGLIIEVSAWHHANMSGYSKDEMEENIV